MTKNAVIYVDIRKKTETIKKHRFFDTVSIKN